MITTIKELRDGLVKMSMHGTIRINIGACNRQGRMTWWTESQRQESISGSLDEILEQLSEEIVEQRKSDNK